MGLRVTVKWLSFVLTSGHNRFRKVELLAGVVAVVERVTAHDVVVLGFDGGLVVLHVRAGSGLLDAASGEPLDQIRVDELAAVVGVEHAHGHGERVDEHADGGSDVDERVVVGAAVERVPGLHVGDGQGAGAFAPQRGSAVHDGVRLDHARDPIDVVHDMDWVLFPVFYWVTGVALV
jgi:hypothetical protein